MYLPVTHFHLTFINMPSNTSVNKIILLGHVAKEPKLHVIGNEKALCFPVIINETIRKGGVDSIHQELAQVKVYEDLPCLDKIQKGRLVYIQGKIHTKQIVDENLVKHYRTEIIAIAIDVMEMTEASDLVSL